MSWGSIVNGVLLIASSRSADSHPYTEWRNNIIRKEQGLDESSSVLC